MARLIDSNKHLRIGILPYQSAGGGPRGRDVRSPPIVYPHGVNGTARSRSFVQLGARATRISHQLTWQYNVRHSPVILASLRSPSPRGLATNRQSDAGY